MDCARSYEGLGILCCLSISLMKMFVTRLNAGIFYTFLALLIPRLLVVTVVAASATTKMMRSTCLCCISVCTEHFGV